MRIPSTLEYDTRIEGASADLVNNMIDAIEDMPAVADLVEMLLNDAHAAGAPVEAEDLDPLVRDAIVRDVVRRLKLAIG